MKKIIKSLVVLSMIIGLTACTKENNSKKTNYEDIKNIHDLQEQHPKIYDAIDLTWIDIKTNMDAELGNNYSNILSEIDPDVLISENNIIVSADYDDYSYFMISYNTKKDGINSIDAYTSSPTSYAEALKDTISKVLVFTKDMDINIADLYNSLNNENGMYSLDNKLNIKVNLTEDTASFRIEKQN